MTSRHARHWDRLAPTYDDLTVGVERRFLGPCRPWVAGRAHGQVLEVGVGTGLNLPHYDPSTTVTGIERSHAMLDEARRRAALLAREVTLREADAGDLPFEDASFDSVVATFVLCCVPDPELALREMARVLRPGGSLLLADHVTSNRWWLRGAQALADVVTVPLQGEHFSRRPLPLVQQLGMEVLESVRTTKGLLERVHARTPTQVSPRAE